MKTMGATLAVLAILAMHSNTARAADAAPTPTTGGVRGTLEAVMPAGVRIREVRLDGLHATVKGASGDVHQVSQFLRAVDGSPSFRNPKLDAIDKGAVGDTAFTMTMDVQCPKPGEHPAHNPCDAAAAASGGTSVFKCIVNGTPTYQSTPCPPAPKKR